MLCCSPVLPNRYRWFAEKLAYGAVPACLAVAATLAATRLLVSEFSRRNGWLICFALVMFTGFLDLGVFWRLHVGYDDGLRGEWNLEARIFDWGSGQVRIPPGFRYEKLSGIDTLMGRFISEDGRVIIEHDIGELAGEHGGMGRNEVMVEGSRVKTGTATRADNDGATSYFFKASFPDCGCANFYLETLDRNDQAAIDAIVASFRPKRGTPSWLRPLLPEVWRTDCRYRFRLPDAFLKALDRLL